MKYLPYIAFFAASIFLSCKSSEKAGNNNQDISREEATGEETIGIEKETYSEISVDAAGANGEGRNTSSQLSNARQMATELAGDWKWIRTSCCGRMNKDTYPEEGDADKVISFDGKGTATFFTNSERDKVSDVPYTIGSLGPKQPTVKIGELMPAIFYVQNDTLILNWGYVDLQIEFYQRVR